MSEATEPYRPLGLLAFLDPNVRAEYDVEQRKRNYAIERVADRYGYSLSHASALLDEDDRVAIQWFCVGNNNPRDVLH